MNLATRLREIRKDKGYTQGELAKLANLATSCVSMIEIGQREANAHTITSLARALGVSSDYLLGLEDDFGVVQRNVSNGVNGGIIYNEDEKELLENFRRLSPNEQYGILIQTKALADKKLNLIKK